ncbi:MAG: restriction endonuclease, partial [Pseudoxanthomonas sp.]
MPSWLSGASVTLLLGASASVYLWVFQRRNDETSAGLQALAGMRWRDFSRLVISALAARGLRPLGQNADEVRSGQEPSVLLGDDQGQRFLLGCKHGSAYRLGSVAIEELASESRLRGAQGAILATEGVVDGNGREKAQYANVELLDGPHLWQQVRQMLDGPTLERIESDARLRARRTIGFAWIAALLLGIVCSGLLHSGDEDASLAAPVPAANTVVPPAVTATAPAAATARAPASAPTPAP